MADRMPGIAHRKLTYEVERCFVDRWSPRAMSGEEFSDNELLPLFEAARWAPSSYHNQPWRYAKRNTSQWPVFFALLVPGNQTWVQH